MARALKTVGTVLGTIALVAGTIGTLGLGGPAFAAVALKVATVAGVTATPASLPETIIAKGPSIEQAITHYRDRGWHGGAGRGLDRHVWTRNAGIRGPGWEGGDDRRGDGNAAESPGWLASARTGGLAA